MKIITSFDVMCEANIVGTQIAQMIEPHYCAASLEGQISTLQNTYNALKHYNFEVNYLTEEVTLEIDDKVIIAIIKLYGKMASTVNVLINVAKSLWPVMKADAAEVTSLMNELRIPE